MELDEARLVAVKVGPVLEKRLDDICQLVISHFRRGNLTQELVAELYADLKATRKLLVVVESNVGGQNG